MGSKRTDAVQRNLLELLTEWKGLNTGDSDLDAPVRDGFALTGRRFLELLEAQFGARHLDLEARELKDRDEGFYTIASAGHEGNAAVAAALRPTDPAFLHYRSTAFFIERARQVPQQTPLFDILLSLCASSDDPIAGGRHKLYGSKPLLIYPQTSTIASHMPKAMGHAVGLERAKRLGLPLSGPDEAIVVCSFGDATLNHSTALGAINTALWVSYQRLPVPILLLCEDNQFGISVHTPEGWVERAWGNRPGLEYFRADGLDLVDTYETTLRAVQHCRTKRAPTFLHLKLVRLLGHGGTDVELAYRTIEEIKSSEKKDPLLKSCRTALNAGLATTDQLRDLYEEIGTRVRAGARAAARRPHLDTAAAVIAPLAPHSGDAVKAEAERDDYQEARSDFFGGDDRLPENQGKRHLTQMLNWGLGDLLVKYPEMLAFGQDVGKRGGVYGITAGLMAKAGGGRVFNTLLDEQSILGLAIGTAQVGFLPVPEIQYLAYYHNAEDQIRGEASSLQFFSQGQFRNPMVVRIAGWAYQKGFGGHFHNENSIAALRDIPGVVVCTPARGDDAAGMLRTAMALAKIDGRVVIFVEPIALYMTHDLYEEEDDKWLSAFPAPGAAVPFGKARLYTGNASKEDDGGNDKREGDNCDHDNRDGSNEMGGDLTIVSWANGLWRSLRAARTLEREHGVKVRVVDLRWLQPFDVGTLCEEARTTGHLLIVDEGRRTGGLSEALMAAVVEELTVGDDPEPLPRMARYCAHDTFVPLGPAWDHVLPQRSRNRRARLEAHWQGQRSGGPLSDGPGTPKRAVVLCPGRGSYTASELGYLSRPTSTAARETIDAAIRPGRLAAHRTWRPDDP